MECEVRVREMDGSAASVLGLLEEQVQVATDKLLLTDFAASVSLCRHIVAATKSQEESIGGISDERLGCVKETATVLAIQALAEQGLWRDVIPFVEQSYGHIRVCPPKVIQMCVLLHAHMREYMVCHSLVNNWLDIEEHCRHPDSANTVKIYVKNVLVPLGAYNLIPQIVESCPALSSEDRQMLLTPTPSTTIRTTNGADKLTTIHRDQPSQTSNDPLPAKKDKGKEILPTYINLVRRLWRSAARKGVCRKVCRVSKFIILLSFAMLALLHLQTDVVSQFSRAMEVWRTAFKVLSNMWKAGQ